MDLLLNNKFFFDSHIHYCNEIDNLPIEKAIICSIKESDWKLIEQQNSLKFVKAYGVHPWFVSNLLINWDKNLEIFLSLDKNSIIGEIGLDFCHNNHNQQEKIFITQLKLASKLNRSIIIHSVRSWHRTIPILEKYFNRNLKVMFHSFSASDEILKKLITNKNNYFSISSKSDMKNINLIPLDKILVESDYENNDISYNKILEDTFIKLAKKLKVSVDELYKITKDNFYKFLDI